MAWEIVIEKLSEIDPILAEKCVPECVSWILSGETKMLRLCKFRRI